MEADDKQTTEENKEEPTPPKDRTLPDAASNINTLSEAEEYSRSLVQKWIIGSTAVSWIPGSSFVVGAADTALILQIAKAFKIVNVDPAQVLAAVSGLLAARGLTEILPFVIPGIGWLAKPFANGGITKAMGEAIISYMRVRSPLR